MARLLGIIGGLMAELALIWFCWGNYAAPSDHTVLQFWRQPQNTQPATEPEETTLPLDDPVAGVMLIARSLLPYEGQEMPGSAALELWNGGDKAIAYAQVIVVQGERELRFEAADIPPGGRVIVPERDGQPYLRGAVTEVFCPVVIPGS